MTTQEIGDLTVEQKRDRLAQLLQDPAQQTSNLTAHQHRLWFLHRLDPTVPHHSQRVLTLPMDLDEATVAQALAHLIQQHPLLRSTFTDVGGHPVRLTAPVADVALASAEPDADVSVVAHEEFWRPFDLACGPLVRAASVRSDDGLQLVLTAHAIVVDDGAADMLARQLKDACTSLAAGLVPEVGPCVDPDMMVARERRTLSQPETERVIVDLTRRLANVPPLPLGDRPRRAARTFHAARATTSVPPSLTCGPGAPTASEPGIASAALLAAVALVLARRYDTRSVVLGTRCSVGGDNEFGSLGNDIPVVIDICDSPGLSVSEFIHHVEGERERACNGADIPFATLAERLSRSRDLATLPVFAVSVNNVQRSLTREIQRPSADFVAVDLQIELSDTGLLEVAGPSDIFTEAGLTELVGRIGETLTRFDAEPERALADLEVLLPTERAQLAEWEVGPDPTADVVTVTAPLDAVMARSTPRAPAIVCGDEQITYPTLRSRTAQLSHRLRDLGIAPGDRVAVLVRRDCRSVIDMLSVLMAGAAYVPISPDLPAPRLRYLLSDCSAAAVIGSAADAHLVKGELIYLASDWDDSVRADLGFPIPQHTGHDEAYVMYTSGTTGAPKGVVVEHRQLAASTAARLAAGMGGDIESYLALAPLTFDAVGAGIYGSLLSGGTLILPTDDEVHDPRRIARLLHQHRPTQFNAIPSQYELLLETDFGALESVRAVIVAGEECPPRLAELHRRRVPEVDLFNEYGPTESTIWASAGRCEPQDVTAEQVPIGRPVAGTRTMVLDCDLRRRPVGTAGELFVAGAQIARGYLDQPALTAERFLPDPWGPPGSRMYRTGDRVRWGDDGRLRHLGRGDDQVKIRGYRVELSELETVLLRHPDVAAAAVVAREAAPGRQVLAAYVVAQDPGTFDRDSVVSHVLAELPDYMAPSSVTVLPALPLTAHGKLDRAGLPAPAERVGDFAVPTTENERLIASVFSDVLGVVKIGLDDSFFDLGGDSLLVAKVLSRLDRDFCIDIDVDEFFAVPTVRGIADRLSEGELRRGGRLDDGAFFARDLAELRAEIRLPDDIRPDELPLSKLTQPDHVLLTGGTGYMGAYALVELLRQTDAVVHCLTRAVDHESGWAKLESVLRTYQIWDESYRGRIRLVLGDLAQPHLGLCDADWDDLAATIDTIHHYAALVNFTFPYDALRRPNVGGTVELLRLATTTTLKGLHYISTMDVYHGTGAARPYLENDLPDQLSTVPTGYPRSKYVAERICSLARERGVPVVIFRPWQVIGHSATGAVPLHDFIFVSLKGWLEIGVLPEFTDVVNTVTVDYFAAAQVYIAHQETAFGRVFNLGNPNPPSGFDLYRWLRSFGYRPEIIDYEDARARALAVDQSKSLFKLTPVIRNAHSLPQMQLEVQARIDTSIEGRNAREALRGSNLTCPPISEEHAHRCLQYLVDAGFLPQPEPVAGAAG